MRATTFLYTLNCPLTGEIRYLGKSDNPFKRFKGHLELAHVKQSHKNSWILSLRAQELKPWMELLDEAPVAEWQFWEREYIRVFRAIGIKLTNLTEGGDGSLGHQASTETRQKMRASHKGHRTSTETRNKIRSSLKGRPRSLEICEKLSVSHIGKSHSADTKRKMSVSRTGKACTQSTRLKISRSMRGRKEGLINGRIHTTLYPCVINS